MKNPDPLTNKRVRLDSGTIVTVTGAFYGVDDTYNLMGAQMLLVDHNGETKFTTRNRIVEVLED